MKIKKCGEMARKLRFFKEQMVKAGFSPSTKSEARGDIDVDDLEVHHLLSINAFFILFFNSNCFFLCYVLGETWRA